MPYRCMSLDFWNGFFYSKAVKATAAFAGRGQKQNKTAASQIKHAKTEQKSAAYEYEGGLKAG